MTGKILTGGKSNIEKITKGLGEVLFERADLYGDNILQIDALTGKAETFASVKLRSIRLAISLQKFGITAEDIIVTCLKMTMDTVVPHLAVLYLGAKFAAIDPIQTDKDWRHCLGIVKPRLIFVDEDQVERLKKCLADSEMKPELIILGESSNNKIFREWVQPSPEEYSFRPKITENIQDPALIMFSSGTTGLPKAMVLSHSSLMKARQVFLETYGTEFFKVELLFSSFYWLSSMMVLIRCFLTGGCRVLFKKFDPEEALRAIEKYKVTSCLIAPSAAQHLLKVENVQDYDLSSVKVYLSGGTSIFPEHILQLRSMFREGLVMNVYGSTEAGGCITRNDFEQKSDSSQNYLKTVGKCFADAEIKFIDAESKKILGPNQSGEIWVKSSFGMSGYYKDSTPSIIDSDGFFRSGDIGYYDENDFIYINGRANDMFKYGVLKVIPEHWELVLKTHPAVYDAGVFGIPHGSDGWLPAACIVLKKQANATAEEIEAFLMAGMTERHRLVGGIRFVEAIPMTPSYKVRRSALFDVFTHGRIVET